MMNRWLAGGLVFALWAVPLTVFPCPTEEARAIATQVYNRAYAGYLDNALHIMEMEVQRRPECLLLRAYWIDLMQWYLLNRWIHEDVHRSVEQAFEAVTEVIIRQARRRRLTAVRDPYEAFAYGVAYLLRAQWYGFQRRWLKLIGPLRTGKRWMDRAYELNPEIPEVQYYLGIYNYDLDRRAWVFKILRWLLAIPGGDRATGWRLLWHAVQKPSPLQGEIHMVITGFLQNDGRWMEALEHLQRIRRTYPTNPFFHFWEGLFYERVVVDYEAAFRIYRDIWERAQRGTPPSYTRWVAFQARYRMGYAAYKRFRFREALQYFQDVVTMGDRDPPWVLPWTYIAMGHLYRDWGKFEKARTMYGRAMQLPPVMDSRERAARALHTDYQTPFWQAYVRYVRGRVHLAEGRIQEGCQYFQLWLKDHEDPIALLGMGECELFRNQMKQAQRFFWRAVSLAGTPNTRWAQAKAALYLGKIVEGRARDRARAFYLQVRAYPHIPWDIRQAALFRQIRLEYLGGTG